MKDYTVQQIVDEVAALAPRSYLFRSQRNDFIVTPTIHSVDGKLLKDVDGCVGCGYVRVSTERQRCRAKNRGDVYDGYSVADQVERIVGYYADLGMAFVVYSDAGLSGKVPINDANLIERARQHEVEKYKEIFDSVFLSPYIQRRYTHEQQRSLAAYRDKKMGSILANGMDNPDEDSETAVRYRPALTHLVRNAARYHTLALTDSSRLCRSLMLTSEIVGALKAAKVRFQGLIENLAYWNERGLGADITMNTMATIAEHRLTEVLSGSLRGTLQMLESGRSPMKVGGWLTTDTPDGKPALNEYAPRYRRMAELFLETEGGSNSIANALYAEGITDKNGKAFKPASIYAVLQNDNLIGIVEEFGLKFDILPHLIDNTTWERLQAKIKHRQINRSGGTEQNRHLASNLLTCTCGGSLIWRPNGKSEGSYGCNIVYNGDPQKVKYPHCFLPAGAVHQFLNGLMENFGNTVLELTGAAIRAHEIETELVMLRKQQSVIESQLADEYALGLCEARRTLKAVEGTSPFDNLIEGLAKAHVERSGLTTKREPLNARIRVAEAELALAGSEQLAGKTLEDAIKEWHALSEQQRNRLLRRIFARLEIVGERNGDSMPRMHLRIRTHSPRPKPLPDIPILYRAHGKRWIASLPTAENWIMSV